MNLKFLTACFLILFLPFAVTAQDTAPNTDSPAATEKKAENQKPDDQKPENSAADDKSTVDKASYLFGFNMITRLKQQEAEFSFDQLIAGLNAANEGAESGMTIEEQRSVLQTWQKMMRAKAQERRRAEAAKNGEEGEKAMAEFAKQEGAQQLEDGVMYVIMKDGDGEIPELPDRVKLNYKGTFTNGEVFDSTETKGEPMVNGVGRFVPGFSKAIQSMKVGSKWKVFIRGDKAYGMRPAKREMGPNRALIFEIELLEIMPVE